jgi:streptogramin lyase
MNSKFSNNLGKLASNLEPDCTALTRRSLLVAGSLLVVNLSGCDSGENPVRKVPRAPLVNTGTVSTLVPGASFASPHGVAVDSVGNVYVSDTGTGSIKKIDLTNTVTTIASSLNQPYGLAVDANNNVYVAETGAQRIRKIDSSGVVTVFAGSGSAGSANGQGTAASFWYPTGIAIDPNGILYVVDQGSCLIRKIDASANVTTLAGKGSTGNTNGLGTSASFYQPYGLAVDANNRLFVADTNNNLVRLVDTSTGMVSTYAGSGALGSTNSSTPTGASFFYPSGVAVDADGNVYIADQYSNSIRKIDTTGVVTTLAGFTIGNADGQGSAAKFNAPFGVCVDALGRVYVADTFNNKIRLIQ